PLSPGHAQSPSSTRIRSKPKASARARQALLKVDLLFHQPPPSPSRSATVDSVTSDDSSHTNRQPSGVGTARLSSGKETPSGKSGRGRRGVRAISMTHETRRRLAPGVSYDNPPPGGFRTSSDRLVGLDRFDPQTIQPLTMPVQHLDHEPFSRLLAAKQRAQPFGRPERPRGLRERFAHDALRELTDQPAHAWVVADGPGQLVKCEGLLILALPESPPHDLGRHTVQQRDQDVGEVCNQRVPDVVEGLRLDPISWLGVIEERIEVGTEPVDQLL